MDNQQDARDAVEHFLNGKPLHQCSCDELSQAIGDGEACFATADVWTDAQDQRLRAINAAFDAKPEDEKAAFQAYWEANS